MSAICGIYSYGRGQVCSETGAAMLNAFKQYHADDSASWFSDEVFLGCHAQHVTPESLQEKLPYHDARADMVITADAIIDNRHALFESLSISNDQRNTMPDSILILEAYKKWGQDSPRYLIGDFAFVIWDGRRKELFCATDALGTRTFYYTYREGMFAFSTLMKPLFVLPEVERKFNDIWIADFLSMPTVMHQLDPEITLYEGIFLLPAGHTLTVGQGGIAKARYWQATPQRELRLASDTEYEEAFLDLFGEAVRCRMRSRRPVAVMMSGGLDSTSIACMAARELTGEGHRLQTFSAVPMAGYSDWLPETRLADETPYIEEVKQYAGNIDVMYSRSEGRHSLSNTDRLFAMLEQPYKIFENLFWLDSILATARDKKIGIVLHGAGGNVTISWGDFFSCAAVLVRQGKWSVLLDEAKAYASRNQRPLTRVMASLLLRYMPYAIEKTVSRLRSGDKYDPMELSPVNREFAQYHRILERFRHFNFDPLLIKKVDRYEMLGPSIASHGAPISTKLTLAYGVAMRDPTMDKRIIEFCLSLPEEQYFRNGMERRFIRETMRGILPDKVRLNVNARGKQSADWLQRLLPDWTDIAGEIAGIGELEAERHYLDINKVRQALKRISAPSSAMADDFILRMLLRALVFSRFLRNERKIQGKGV